MSQPQFFRSARPRALGRALWTPASALILIAFVLDAPARAIPSPDVVIGLFASAAQVLGVATVILGRWFFVRKGQGYAPGARRGSTFAIPFACSAALFLASALGWGFYYLHVQDQHMARLRVNLLRSSTENGKLVGDVNLKTLSFSDQKKRADGIATEELQAMLDRAAVREPMFDIRESEEVEVGSIAGTVHMRYPDLLRHPERYLEPGSPVILLCFNGNRSSETADALRPLGYEPRFMVGGYEKWCAEERPLAMQPGFVRKDLREIPDYANKEALLDTAEVTRLVNEEDALFLDVRYPGEFELQGHLPGAHNLTMRSMTTPELETALAAVPKRPIIGVCYDKRGSFFALIVGLRLTRLGYDWRGRYTVPEEYYVPSKDKAHVLAWQEAHADKTLLAAVAAPLRRGLDRLTLETGSLALGILGLVLALRFALLPLTLKSERDRLEQRRIEGELAELKRAYGDDRRGAARATLRTLREHRIRPMLNLLGTSAQLVLFLVFCSVVADASAENETEGFLWLPLLSGTDPWRALPVLVAALALAQLALSAAKRTLVRASLWTALACGLFFLVVGASGGVLLYLSASLALMLLHTAAVGAWFRATRRPRRTAPDPRLAALPVVALEHAHQVDGTGRKAARLGELLAVGLPVPPGFVVRAQAVERFLAAGRWDTEDLARIRAAHATLGAARVAVRSSGAAEDGAQSSFAGVYESLLDVAPDGLVDALSHVARSHESARARAFRAGSDRDPLGVVVQAMVPAEHAGVMFTEHPGESGSILVECVRGLGDDLVSGRAQPSSHRFGRASGELLDPAAPALDLAPLVALGRRVEALFGRPQDVEWAFAQGRFLLLQARDITRTSRSGEDARALRESERARLLELVRGEAPDAVALAQNELSELLPAPTPYSAALMQELWAHGGSTDLACRELSVPYEVQPDSPPMLVTAFGRLYVHRAEERRRLAKGPGSLATFRLARGAEALERRFREEFLPVYLRRSRLDLAADLSRFSTAELADLHRERRTAFVREVYVEAEIVNVAADILFKAALRGLEKRGLDPAEILAHTPGNVVDDGLELLGEVGRGARPASEFLATHGHRSPLDYELSQPRYGEDAALVRELAARAAAAPPRVRKPAPRALGSRVLALSVERARRFASLKEEAKHHALRELSFLRRIALELGARTGLGARVFQLAPEEVEGLASASTAAALALCDARAERDQALRELELASDLTPRDLEALDVERGQRLAPRAERSRLVGVRVSGAGGISGRARVLRDAGLIDTLLPGEILVARFTDPAWTPAFPRCGGIVTEVGGWLSHAAILAREHGLTAIVGARGALDSVATGDLLRLGEDGSVELFADRRMDLRTPTRVPVTIQSRDGAAEGELRDLSRFGARLALETGALRVGEHFELRDRGGSFVRDALVVRNGVPGLYGLSFEEPLPERELGQKL